MNKLFYGALFTVLVCIGCGQQGGGLSSLNKESEEAAKKELGKTVIFCNGNCFVKNTNRNYHEYQKINFHIQPETLTEADKANNIEWKGFAGFQATDGSASRECTFGKTKGCSEWKIEHHGEGLPFISGGYVYLTKKNGLWNSDSKFKGSALTCDDLPK
jgi:hypothetical protein